MEQPLRNTGVLCACCNLIFLTSVIVGAKDCMAADITSHLHLVPTQRIAVSFLPEEEMS